MTEAHEAPVPRVAIVIPVYRQPVLITEALRSALSQEAEFAIRIVIVNDGCPYRETDAICRAYAASQPGRVTYLRKPNGGLSEARNFGIRHVLDWLPSVEAIFMLDSDNRLRPRAIARGMAELDAHPEAAWIYPNIDMFALASASDYGGDYSVLLHAAGNICEAGSLIRRQVFDAGVLYDTSFKLGYEDWDFYLTAARHGFRGRNLENFGFLYRKRPESMLADSDRDREVILAALRLKHRDFFKPARLVDVEHVECPRYACYASTDEAVSVFTDPDESEARSPWTVDECEAELWKAILSPGRFHFPEYFIATRSAVLHALRRLKVLHWVLWRLECLLESGTLAALVLEREASDAFGFAVERVTFDECPDAALCMVRRHTVERLVTEGGRLPHVLAAEEGEEGSIALLRVFVPEVFLGDRPPRATALQDLASILASFGQSHYRAAGSVSWEWRKLGISVRRRAHEVSRAQCNGEPTLPRKRRDGRHVGIVLDLTGDARLSARALHVGRELTASGTTPHLVLVNEIVDASLLRPWSDTVETISFFQEHPSQADDIRVRSFFGDLIPYLSKETAGVACGLMHWLDAVILFDGGQLLPVTGELRRLGVSGALAVELPEDEALAPGGGAESSGVAYEHSLDLLIASSSRERSWLHSRGVPCEKIALAPPGFTGLPPALKDFVFGRR